jgi:2-hydroxy-6-oxo-octa-2,4-dienoate hydrolase
MNSNESRVVDAGGIRTVYHDHGTGPTIVLLHGSGPGVSAWQNWSGIIPRLAQRFRVVAPDIAGFGDTDNSPERSYNIKLWSRHLLDFLEALEIERPLLVGNSFGGGLALAVAARHPDRIGAMVLMGTPAGEFVQTEGLRSGWFYEPDRTAMERILKLFPHDPSVITPAMIEERYLASARPGAQEAFRRLIPEPGAPGETMVRGVSEAVLATLPHRVLVLHGREDKVVPPVCGFRIAENVARADLHLFGECGHWVMLERPDAFVTLVSNFADEVLA